MKYDVAIIGGGASGMMAAISASEQGARVILLEKNKRLGLKLLMTGGGRCNITNNILDPKELANCYGDKGKFLISAFNKFGVAELIEFLENHGVLTKIEKDNQVFPVSDRANEVLDCLLSVMKKRGVIVKNEAEVKQIIKSDETITKIILTNGEEVEANNYIIATGGRSYPRTGSSGDAYLWLKELGHSIVNTKPALAPLIVREKIVSSLEGLSLNSATLTLIENGREIITLRGGIVFTAQGISGPAALNLSRYIKIMEKSVIKLDLFPYYSLEEFDLYLRDLLSRSGSRLFKNGLDDLAPPKLRPLIMELANIDPDKQVSVVTSEERKKLLNILKNWQFNLQSLGGYDKAIVTAGGVALTEINPKNMQSKIISNLFIAGELLDLDGPSGGYNLQMCWSTGYVAGLGAAAK